LVTSAEPTPPQTSRLGFPRLHVRLRDRILRHALTAGFQVALGTSLFPSPRRPAQGTRRHNRRAQSGFARRGHLDAVGAQPPPGHSRCSEEQHGGSLAPLQCALHGAALAATIFFGLWRRWPTSDGIPLTETHRPAEQLNSTLSQQFRSAFVMRCSHSASSSGLRSQKASVY
jgi:hypothetical protein